MAECIISSNLSSIVIYLDLGYKITFFFFKKRKKRPKNIYYITKN